MSLVIDIFREIANPKSTENREAQERLGEARTHERIGPALEKFRNEQGEVLGNFALAAITLGTGYIDPKDIERTVKDTNLDDFGEIFKNLARGHTPAEIVSFPLGYLPEEVDPMVNALTAAGIFDAGRNDLHPDVIDLLGDLVRHQPPPALAGRRRRQLFGK